MMMINSCFHCQLLNILIVSATSLGAFLLINRIGMASLGIKDHLGEKQFLFESSLSLSLSLNLIIIFSDSDCSCTIHVKPLVLYCQQLTQFAHCRYILTSAQTQICISKFTLIILMPSFSFCGERFWIKMKHLCFTALYLERE